MLHLHLQHLTLLGPKDLPKDYKTIGYRDQLVCDDQVNKHEHNTCSPQESPNSLGDRVQCVTVIWRPGVL